MTVGLVPILVTHQGSHTKPENKQRLYTYTALTVALPGFAMSSDAKEAMASTGIPNWRQQHQDLFFHEHETLGH